MPLSVSDYLKVPAASIEAEGAFNSFVDFDSLLFIDPALLNGTCAPEFRDSHKKVVDHFGKIMLLVKNAKERSTKDIFWRTADEHLAGSEVDALRIGYSGKGRGSGIGPDIRERLLNSAKDIITAGYEDPEIFELVGFFEPDIGSDRICDLVARILLPEIAAFTERVLLNCGVTVEPIKYLGITVRSVKNLHKQNHPILLAPRDVLRDLPVALDWDQIGSVVSHNLHLRIELNKTVGDTWKELARKSKEDRKKAFQDYPELYSELLSAYRKRDKKSYDYDKDPLGLFLWYPAIAQLAEAGLIDIPLDLIGQLESVRAAVESVLKQFQHLIEHNGLWSLLYNDDGKNKREAAGQKLFFGIADYICKQRGVDLSAEPNAGSGAVDFKLSRGTEKVVVEAKLSSNQRLLHGYKTQLKRYQEAESAEYGVFLIILVGDGHQKRIKEFKEFLKDGGEDKTGKISVFFVDGTPKDSASKFHDKAAEPDDDDNTDDAN